MIGEVTKQQSKFLGLLKEYNIVAWVSSNATFDVLLEDHIKEKFTISINNYNYLTCFNERELKSALDTIKGIPFIGSKWLLKIYEKDIDKDKLLKVLNKNELELDNVIVLLVCKNMKNLNIILNGLSDKVKKDLQIVKFTTWYFSKEDMKLLTRLFIKDIDESARGILIDKLYQDSTAFLEALRALKELEGTCITVEDVSHFKSENSSIYKLMKRVLKGDILRSLTVKGRKMRQHVLMKSINMLIWNHGFNRARMMVSGFFKDLYYIRKLHQTGVISRVIDIDIDKVKDIEPKLKYITQYKVWLILRLSEDIPFRECALMFFDTRQIKDEVELYSKLIKIATRRGMK